MFKKLFFVYILTNNSSTLYIGITSNLGKRLYEHRNQLVEGFTKKYNIHKLIYYEFFDDAATAIAREKQLKRWSRKKKLWLVSQVNPKFEEIKIEEII